MRMKRLSIFFHEEQKKRVEYIRLAKERENK